MILYCVGRLLGPPNVTVSDCVINETVCNLNISWESHTELDLLGYVVFIHAETVNDTFVGPDGTYLTENEQRFPLRYFPVNY